MDINEKQFLTLCASAGSGKTFSLTLRYLSLLFLGATPNEILTITFTKKATSEMKERIIKAIKNLGHPDDKILPELCNQYGFKKDEVLKNAPKILNRFITSSPKIKTIDAFLNSIVKKFCWYAGISNRYEIQQYDTNEILERFLNKLDKITKNELSAFISRYDTRLSLIENLSFHDVISEYKNNNLKDLEEQLRLKEASIQKDILELKKIIQSKKTKSSRAIDAIKDSLSENLSSTWLAKGNDYNYFKKLNLDPQIFEKIQQNAKKYFEIKNQAILTMMSQMVAIYKQAREDFFHSKHTLNHDDISQKAKEILTKNIDRDFFYFRLDDKINHILIDEFQDTNPLQYEIFLPLIDEIKSGEGAYKNRSLFFVGDPKQSIYQFRGADSKIFEEVIQYTSKEDLPYNYRSQKRLVDFNNDYFSQIFSKSYLPQQTQSEENKGFIKVYEPTIIPAKDTENSIQEALTKVLESVDLLLSKGVLPHQITILCYKNSEITLVKNFLEEKLNIQVSTQQSLKISQMPQVQILIQCLQYAIVDTKHKPYFQKNIAKLLGKSFDDEIEIPQYSDTTLSGYIFLLMRHFKICDHFAKQALEISFSHHHIDTFISQLENTTAQKQELSRNICIMTIHSSKGLEFDHVIYCGRLGKIRNQHTPFIINKKRIFLKQNGYEKLDATYQEALKQHQEDRLREENNLIYVAFTRAKKSLFVIPTSVAKKEAESLFIFPETQTIGEIEPNNACYDQKDSVFESIAQKDYGRQNSFVVTEDKFYEIKELDMLFGQALHLGLEYTFYLKDDILLQKIKNQYGFYIQNSDLLQILKRINHLKEQDQFKNSLKNKKIYPELTYTYQEKINRIDLLLAGQDHVVIIDYKSGQKKPEHFEQINNYASFVQKKIPTAQIESYILYLWDQPKMILAEK